MYTIGEFSRITSITVKALRLYHDKGLLQPSFIDQGTHYRYYSKRDIEIAYVITELKSMKFSLSEIKNALSEMTDEAEMTQVLTLKKEKINKEIESLNTISSVIDVILTKQREALKMTVNTGDVQRREPRNMLLSPVSSLRVIKRSDVRLSTQHNGEPFPS